MTVTPLEWVLGRDRGIGQGNGGRFNAGNFGRDRNFNGGRGNGGKSDWNNNWNNTGKPQCQLCRRFGHEVERCYYRFDPSFVSPTSSSQNSGGPRAYFSQASPHSSTLFTTPEVFNDNSWPINEVDLPSVPNVHSISPIIDVVVHNIISSSNTNLNRMTGQPRVQGNTHVMTTRSKNGIAKPKVYIVAVKEPETVELALQKDEWKQAMISEFEALQRNNTWSLVPLPEGRIPIGCRWVYKVKENSDGSVGKYKARLVAKGFHQQAGFDFNETFSPIVKPTTIMIVLTITLSRGWSVRQLDINNAFLNGILQEKVFMSQPQGFLDEKHHEYVCRQHKALYGLKQAPRAWFERLHKAFL
ncbi:hypothetical protein VitviT2T_009118 [Vitis vinifera]|uniref:Reverse transcriptase Ty1/copia-type domain-containing protein n=1 Tax=Vitis vinifera TaxID=29760 RepID=A0ABY9C488_VITVI|nr:hypothetical protein VitviT2T_009118 [Vitis vinifera]